MRQSHRTRTGRKSVVSRVIAPIAACLLTIFTSVILMNLETPSAARNVPSTTTPAARHSKGEAAASSASGSAQTSAPSLRIGADDLRILNDRNLIIPVQGVAANQLHDSFYEPRSEGRIHQALDILAPGETPVLAADDGFVVKLNQSAKGGTTLYESDRSGLFVYYYAHLSRYADGVSEGKQLKRGDIIAYVGDTGNAGSGNFHLHFGISKMSSPGRWSGGEPIDPYPLLVR